MNNPLISIIVPVYNVESFLPRCLESLIHQSYPNTEIILINDGATDNSLEICDYYSESYKNVFLISQKNKGLSGARNTGLRDCHGEYISFVDSDDWIHPNMISQLYRIMSDTHADASFCGSQKTSSEQVRQIDETKIQIEEYNKDRILKAFFRERYTACWSRLFKAEIIKDIEFPEGLNCEDYIFMFLALRRCQKVAVIDEPYYYYFIRPDSICGSSFNLKKFDAFYSAKRMVELVEVYEPKYKKISRIRLAGALIRLISQSRETGLFSDKKDELLNYLRTHLNWFLGNKYINYKQKIMLAFTALPDPIAKLLINLATKKK